MAKVNAGAFVEAVGLRIFNRAPWFALGAIVVLLIAALGVKNIRVNPDNRVLFSKTNPDRIALEAFEDLFTLEFVSAIVMAPQDGDLFTPKNLEAMRWITQQGFTVPFMRRVDSVTNFQDTNNIDGSLVVSSLIPEEGEITPTIAEQARETALTTPELVHAFVSPSGHMGAISVMVAFGDDNADGSGRSQGRGGNGTRGSTGRAGQGGGSDPLAVADPFGGVPSIDDPFASFEPVSIESIAGQVQSDDASDETLSFAARQALDLADKKELVGEHMRSILAEAKQRYPNVDFYFSGRLVSDLTFAEAARRDLMTLYPIMFLAMIVILGFLTRSVAASSMAVAVMVLTSLATTGLFGWFGMQINVMTMPGPLVLMVLSTLASVHLLSAYFEGRRSGKAHEEAIVHGIQKSIWPIFLTCLTTALGASTLNFSDSPPPRTLGNIVAVGMFVMFFITFTVGVAILKAWPVKNYVTRVQGQLFFMEFGEFVVRHARTLLWVGLGSSVLLTFGMTRIVFDDHFIQYFDRSFDFRVDTDVIEDNLTGMNGLEFALDSGKADGIYDPKYLQQVEAFSQWLRAQDHIVYVHSIVDILKRVNMTLNDDNPEAYKIQESTEQAAQHMLAYTFGLPLNKGMSNRMDVNSSVSRVYASAAQLSAADLRDLASRSEAWLAENAPQLVTQPTGMALMFAKVAQRNVISMVLGTFVALTLISIAMRLVVGNWRYAGMSMFPNIVPMLVSFGIWGWLVGEVNMAISFVGAFTLGIVVDDTVHFLIAYTRSRQKGRNPQQAIVETFLHVGPALFTTSMIIIVGFGILSLSGFAINGNLGQLSVITVAVAAFADFVFLPAILLTFDNVDTGKDGEEMTGWVPTP